MSNRGSVPIRVAVLTHAVTVGLCDALRAVNLRLFLASPSTVTDNELEDEATKPTILKGWHTAGRSSEVVSWTAD
jgi:hypothetical protein